MSEGEVDAIVLGMGTAGLVTALPAHDAGAGGTIGPAMVFGFRAGQDAAARPASSPRGGSSRMTKEGNDG